ncbi:LLM class flavin-dependent oxidoreductase [Goekera deserti]|uniref:LLM class flavin-dependent oxidoreductase n=1 Tax=Goekera deserti TaxID=2497753 RepID=UPI0019545AF9|nr:LLM class flavin-dependent oxidoreductase [Goekera deserti]
MFLPNATNGFILSNGSPQYLPSFEHNKAIVQAAEAQGLDFALSMMKHKGPGGTSDFWGSCLESFSLMSGLAAVTERIELIPSVTLLATHPAVAARMIATLDDISGGRAALNLVTGWNKPEYESLGLWPGDEYFDRRYELAAEYVQVLRRLWTEDDVHHAGEFFQLAGATIKPKPRRAVPLVCAGQSPKGQDFTAAVGDYNFVMAAPDDLRGIVDGLQTYATGHGRSGVGTYALYCMIAEETDAEADRLCQSIIDTADLDAIAHLTGAAAIDTNTGGTSTQLLKSLERPAVEGNMTFLSFPVIKGSYESVARQLDELVERTGIDGILLTWPDFVDGVTKFGERVMPLLTTAASQTRLASQA